MVSTIAERQAIARSYSMPTASNPRGWGGGAVIGTVYKIVSDLETKRVGNCWANGRLREGDYLLCVEKTGDCFYDYVLLEVKNYTNRHVSQIRMVAQNIGAYCLGAPVIALTEDEFQKLMVGALVELGFKI